MKARLSIPEGAELQLRGGVVVGRVTSITVDLDLDVLGVRGKDVEVEVESKDELPPPTPSGKSQTELLPDPVEETWALYTELLERPKVVLTPKVRRWINDAHKAAGVEETRQAIRGLAASDYHRQNGYVDIGYAIVAKRGETVEGRIAMMASKAGTPGNGTTTVQSLIARLPSEAQTMVRQWISDVEAMLRNPDHPGLAATGQSRLNDLRSKAHIEPIIENGRITDWKDVRR